MSGTIRGRGDRAGNGMNVDCHTRFWNDPSQLGEAISSRLGMIGHPDRDPLDATPAAHARATATMDLVLVHGFRAARLGANVPVEAVADHVRRLPERRRGVAGIDPLAPDIEDRLAAANELGVTLVSVSPVLAGFHPAHTSAMRLYEQCADRSLPVFVTMDEPLPPTVILEFGRPVPWAEVARACPDLTLVFCGGGWPWIDEVLALAAAHPRVHVVLPGAPMGARRLHQALCTAQDLAVLDRVLPGSGFPRWMPEEAIQALFSVNDETRQLGGPTIPRTTLASIASGNALRTLGVEPPDQRPTSADHAEASDSDFDELITPSSGLPNRMRR